VEFLPVLPKRSGVVTARIEAKKREQQLAKNAEASLATILDQHPWPVKSIMADSRMI